MILTRTLHCYLFLRVCLVFGEFEAVSGALSPVDAATFDQFGNEAAVIKSPVITSFRPNPTFKDKFGLGESIDFREWATTADAVAPGETLYSLYTTVLKSNGDPSLCVDDDGIPQVDEDVAKWCPEQKVIQLGNVIMTSRFYAAEWPDEWLFFQHHRVCPKDQSVCAFDSDPNTPLPTDPNGEGLGNPDTTYPEHNTDFCLSSDDKSGQITGNLPSCPLGSNFKESGCFVRGDQNEKVVEVQKTTCPMMDKLADDIKFIDPDEDNTDPPACDFGYDATNFFLTVFLTVSSPVLRAITEACGPCKTIIDFSIGVLPFGQ